MNIFVYFAFGLVSLALPSALFDAKHHYSMATTSGLQPPRSTIPYRQIRAEYDDESITVYQAYSAAIAIPAVREQKLSASPEFKPGRMTWIKPSWCWMMYQFSKILQPSL